MSTDPIQMATSIIKFNRLLQKARMNPNHSTYTYLFFNKFPHNIQIAYHTRINQSLDIIIKTEFSKVKTIIMAIIQEIGIQNNA